MERFANKIAVVTGSSSGIGKAISIELLKHGLIVVGLARRLEKLEELNNESEAHNFPGKFHPMKCDVTKELDIQYAFKRIVSEIGQIHILINNAGVNRCSFLTDIDDKQISDVLNTNIKGVLLCSKEAIKSMVEYSIQGHIVIINSMAGHYISNALIEKGMMVYTGSKHALKMLTEGLRRELCFKSADIKISSISPGYVQTDMSDAILEYIDEEKYPKSLLNVQDIANACITVLNTPPDVLISELSIMPLDQPI